MISIIVPFFNSKTTLERCLESMANQTYSDFEVLMIDDGSVDASSEVCSRWATFDSRFKYFYKQHNGVSEARNYGLSLLSGEWFCFVDSDDWIEPDYLQVLYQNAVDNECSISSCDYERDISLEFIPNKDNVIEILEGERDCISGFIQSPKKIYGMVWNKLYSARRYKEIRFEKELQINEDCRYTFEIMRNCDKLVSTKRKLYHWYWRRNSACHARLQNVDFSAADVNLFLLDETDKMGIRDVGSELKKNYFSAAIKVLWETDYDSSSGEVIDVINRLKSWKPLVFKRLTLKTRVKYYISIYFPKMKRWFVKNKRKV